MRQSIQEWTKSNLWKTAFKKFERYMVCFNRHYPFKVHKGSLPQILRGPFLNTLSQMILLKFEQTTMTFSLRKTNVEKTFVFSVIFTFIESQSNPSIS